MKELVGKKVFIVEPLDGINTQFDLYRQSGCELAVGPYVSEKDKGYSKEALIKIGNEYDAVIGMSREKFTRDIIMNSNRVKMIAKTGIGMDHIDIDAATEKGILITNTPSQNDMDVAEFAVGLILSLMKGFFRNDAYLRTMHWRDVTTLGKELYHHRVGLVGFGNIGRHVAKRLSGWECEIIAYDPYISQEKADSFGLNVRMVDWETLFKTSDAISMHLPLTKETRNCVGKREFEMMKKDAIFVNTSRGPIVDLEALSWALHSGEIGAAGIDTHAKEPIGPDYPLLDLHDNVILTSHLGGWAQGGLTRMTEIAARNTIESLCGKLPKYTCNPQVESFWRKRFGI